MSSWRYVEPGDDGEARTVVMTELEILSTYYPYWCEQMCKVGKWDQVSEEACIQDWATVHWAERVEES